LPPTELNTTTYQLEQQPLNVSSLAHQENGIIQSTADNVTGDTHNTLLTSENIAITKMNVQQQPISNGVSHAGDNNKEEDDKQHQILEGEACVVLNANQP
jgi:hypothetical protein